jgi:hypothetical protein
VRLVGEGQKLGVAVCCHHILCTVLFIPFKRLLTRQQQRSQEQVRLVGVRMRMPCSIRSGGCALSPYHMRGAS